MSQARSRRQEPPARDVRPYWLERGYRPELVTLQPSSNEDPKGEAAYQRAFAEAAKSDPPRLPNPQWYPNSTSAQEYTRKRNSDFMLPRASKRPGDESSDDKPGLRKVRDPDRSPRLPTMKQKQESSPVPNFSPSPWLPAPPPLSMPRISDLPPTSPLPLGTPTETSQQSFAAPRLAVLEPYCGPTGPVNKLR